MITTDNVLDYVETNRVTINPGTLRSYFGSFKYFLEYLKKENTQELSEDLLRELIEDVNYKGNLRQAVAERKAEYALQEHENLLPASVIDKFLNSKFLEEVEQVIYDRGTFEGVYSYCKARDALMAMLVCTNALRTSAVRDIRPQNVLKAKVEANMMTFGVAHHETAASRGVANFSLEQRFYRMLQQFATQTCERCDGRRSESSPMFLSFDGNLMEASNAARSIKRALKLSGVLGEYTKNATATMIRKLVTTLVREDEPELVEPLSQQLSHSSWTAEGTYQLKQSQKSSVRVVKTIRKSVHSHAVEERKHGITVLSKEQLRRFSNPEPSPQMAEPSTGINGDISETSPSPVSPQDNFSFEMPTKAEFLRRLNALIEQVTVPDMLEKGLDLLKERREDKMALLHGRQSIQDCH